MSSSLDYRLLNEFQRDFPLVPRPYAAVARRLGVREGEVLAALARLKEEGALSRVGPVFAPRRIGASTLAAVAVPPGRAEAVAELISARPEVNHNYQREHRYNLWFVAAAPSEAALQEVLAGIGEAAGSRVISLPLLEEYHIDLGFDLCHGRRLAAPSAAPLPAEPRILSLHEDRLVAALQGGLALVPRPFERLAAEAGLSETMALSMVGAMLGSGVIKRFGVVVRHHELGYRANAMCVWNVPDEDVSAIGAALAGESAVTLCYRRRRDAPDWPYNLFCMIHGRERAEVEAERAAIAARHGLDVHPHEILFSTRRFKQCGARYASSGAGRLAACG